MEERKHVASVGILAKDASSQAQLYVRCPYCSRNGDNTFIKVTSYRKVQVRGYAVIIGPAVCCSSCNQTTSFRITLVVSASTVNL